MAISQEQKVDFLLKKIGYTKTKTGLAVDSSLTGTKKAGFAEALPSPLVIADSSIWNQSENIPTTPPTSDSSYVKVYLSASSGLRLTEDSTVAGSRAFLAYTTYNDTSSVRLTDWIDTQFGDDYLIKVYKGDPNSGGVQLSASGSGSNDGWFFDYSAGVLNFNDTNVPSGVSSSNIYIVGYRYIGKKGVVTPGDHFEVDNLYVAGLSTFVGVGTFNSHLYVGGNLEVKGTTKFEGGTLTFGDSDTDNVVFGADIDSDIIPDDDSTYDLGSTGQRWRKIWVDDIGIGGTYFLGVDIETRHFKAHGISTFLGAADFDYNVDIAGYLDVDGQATLDDLNVSGVSTLGGAVDINNNVDVSGYIDVDGQTTLDDLNVSGVSTLGGAVDINNNVDVSGYIDVDGQATLDDLNVSGVSTFAGVVDINNNVDVSGYIDVDGQATLDDLNVSGVSTFNDDVTFVGQNYNAFWDKSDNSLRFTDNSRAKFGDHSGTGDLHIYHDNTANDSIISNSTNKLKVLSDKFRLNNVADNKSLIFANDGGAVQLYFDGSKKFSTTGIGVSIHNGIGNTATLAGPSNLVIDPGVVGDDTGSVRIKGDLYVDGTNFTVSSGTIELADHRVGIATTSWSNAILDGGGIGIGSANILKTLVWNNSSSSLKSSENFDIANGKVYKINGTEVLSSTRLGAGVTHIDGHIERLTVIDVNVTGVSTFAGWIDANNNVDIAGYLDVDGQATLDDVNVSGVSTFAGTLNANGDVNLGDATSDTITATGRFDSDLIPSADRTYDLGSPSLYWDKVYATNIGIGTGGGTIGDDLTIRHLLVTGISTFKDNMFLDSDNAGFYLGENGTSAPLQLAGDNANGHAYIQHQAAGDFFIRSDGTFNFTRWSGGPHEKYATFNRDSTVDLYYDNGLRFQTSGIGVTITDQLDVNNINVSAGGTFGSLVDINADLDVDGQTEVDDLNVAGVSTFVGVGTFSSHLYVGGNLEVKGTTKFEGGTLTFGDQDTDNVVFGADIDSNFIPDDDDTYDLGSSTQEWRNLYLDGIGHIDTAVVHDLSVTGVATFPNGIGFTGGSASFEQLHVTGVSTFDGAVDINNNVDVSGYIDVDGQATLDDLNVSGISTFAGAIDANNNVDVLGYIDVDGQTTLDDLNVSGVSTFAGVIDANNNVDIAGYIDVDGQATLDDLNVSGVSTLGGAVDINNNVDVSGYIDVDGQTTLDDLNVSGVSTFTGIGTFASDLYVAGNLNVIGDIVYDEVTGRNLNITGIATFNHVDINGDLDVDGQTEVDDLNVAGVSTFVGIATFSNSDVYISQSLYVNGVQITGGGGGGSFGVDVVTRHLLATGITTAQQYSHIGAGGTVFATTLAGNVGINSTSPDYLLDVGGVINSSNDVKINGTSVLTSAENDAVALAIALG